MKQDKFEAGLYSAPMPGQAFTKPRRSQPIDRPSENTDVGKYLDRIFQKLAEPEVASKFLSILDEGVPLDALVKVVVKSLVGEGKVNTNMMFLMIPPLTVMFFRMAEAAGIDPKLSTDTKIIKPPTMQLFKKKPDNNKVNKASHAAESSREQLSGMVKKGGLMKRPEGII